MPFCPSNCDIQPPLFTQEPDFSFIVAADQGNHYSFLFSSLEAVHCADFKLRVRLFQETGDQIDLSIVRGYDGNIQVFESS